MKYYYRGSDLLWPHALELYVRDVNFFRFNWHPEFEFTVLLRGQLLVSTGGVVHSLHSGDVFLINPNNGHSWMSVEKNSTALSIHFAPEYVSELDSSLKKFEIDCFSTPATRSEARFAQLREYSARMMLAAVQTDTAARFILRGAFSMLIGTLLNKCPLRPGSSHESPRDRKNMGTIQTVTDWIERNYANRISLDAAAKVAGYNRTYFSAFFRRNVGISFYDYLRRVRFRHALHLLNSTNRSLTDIAADCGFPDLKAFSTYYKKIVHELPTERRRTLEPYSFTPAGEGERIFLDTSAPDIEENAAFTI